MIMNQHIIHQHKMHALISKQQIDPTSYAAVAEGKELPLFEGTASNIDPLVWKENRES
jgi:hypothetical protein